MQRLPDPGWAHLLAAVLTAGFFLLLTVKAVPLALLCGFGAIASVMIWMWESDPAPAGRVEIGGGRTFAMRETTLLLGKRLLYAGSSRAFGRRSSEGSRSLKPSVQTG